MKIKFAAIALCVAMLFCGCGKKQAEKNTNPTDNSVQNQAVGEEKREPVSAEKSESDKKIISEMLACFKNSQYSEAISYIREADRSLFDFDNASQSTLYDSILSKIEYTLGDDYYVNEKHLVDASISAPDMLDIYGKINLQYIDAMLNGQISSEDEAREFNNAALKDIVAQGDYKLKETAVRIELQAENGEEKIVFNADLMNAMLGDIQNAQQQVSEAIEEGMAEYNAAKEYDTEK